MISITGDTQKRAGNTELLAAETLKEKILQVWPEIENNQDRIKLVVSPQFNQGKARETDILIVADFKQPRKIALPFSVTKQINDDYSITAEEVWLDNFLAVVEVKDIDQKSLYLDGNNLMFRYPNNPNPKNITKQSSNQIWALQDTFRADPLHKNKVEPFVDNFIYLRTSRFDKKIYDVYGNDKSWKFIMNGIAAKCFRFGRYRQDKENNRTVYSSFPSKDADYYYKTAYLPEYDFTPLDQKQMARISAIIPDAWGWKDLIGKKLFILKGVGGTGKTIRLLQLAFNIYSERNERVLLLTYNRALISNLQRIIALMGISKMNEQGGNLRFLSVHQFMRMLLISYGFITKENSPFFIPNYEKHLKELSQHLKEKSLTKQEIKEEVDLKLSEKFDDESVFDYVFIDEGQDWLKEEAYILQSIFGVNNLSVAHGTNQEVRGKSFDWRTLTDKEHQEQRVLRSARRMKVNIVSFIKMFSEDEILNDDYLNLKSVNEAHGGEVFIIAGDYFSKKENFEQFFNDRRKGSGANIDQLHCVPSSDTVKIDDFMSDENIKEKRYSKTARKFEEYGYEAWDATGEVTRRNRPASTRVMRVLNYESSRGLEGWSVFLHNFDHFWDEKMKESSEIFEKNISQQELFQSSYQTKEEWCRDYSGKWLLIALTRGIDSVVIHIEDKESYIGKKLHKIYQEGHDFIHWLE